MLGRNNNGLNACRLAFFVFYRHLRFCVGAQKWQLVSFAQNREFFENLKDPKLQQQMLGWSNPNPRDTPFKADEVDQYLQQVTGRLSRRRLASIAIAGALAPDATELPE